MKWQTIKNLNEFNEQIKSSDLTIAKFSAEWCAPCQKMTEIIDELKDDYPNVVVLDIDVEIAEDSLLTEYSVKNIPLILFFKDSLIIDKVVGVMPKDKFIEKIEENIKK